MTLAPTATAPGARVPANVNELSESLKRLPAASEFILRLENVRAHRAPGVGYDVYYGLSEGQRPNTENAAYAGTLSFFGAVPLSDHGMADMPGRAYSFSITRPVRSALTGASNVASTVTLVPTGAPAEGSAPTIGSISLISA